MNGQVNSSRMDGLAIGTVLSVDDPNGEGRIQLDMTVATGLSTTAWAPIAALMAGNDRGTWMLPEIGDEALVGFLRGDPDQPYVVGFLWNGQDRPPSTAQKERMIRSLNGHTIRMIDEPPVGGSKGALVIEDAHGNTITMSNGKITIKSVAVLALEAPVVTLSGRVVTPNANPI
jgi:phage baseplate assembly protein V